MIIDTYQTTSVTRPMRPRTREPSEVTLSRELFRNYLDTLSAGDCREDTVKVYRRGLNRLYEFLPEPKRVGKGTLERWRQSLVEQGFAAQTINVHMAAANGLLEYCGHRELQLPRQLKVSDAPQPELSRKEYLRLLSTARLQGQSRTYLLVKVFVTMGISVQEIPLLTVEAAEKGRIEQTGKPPVHIPQCLQKELLDYARQEQIQEGPIFRNQNGKPLHRGNISVDLRHLCRDAQVPEEKGNPKCLVRLYQETWNGIRTNMELLVQQTFERLVEKEQAAIGWAE